jgi:hypothetical protein
MVEYRRDEKKRHRGQAERHQPTRDFDELYLPARFAELRFDELVVIDNLG